MVDILDCGWVSRRSQYQASWQAMLLQLMQDSYFLRMVADDKARIQRRMQTNTVPRGASNCTCTNLGFWRLSLNRDHVRRAAALSRTNELQPREAMHTYQRGHACTLPHARAIFLLLYASMCCCMCQPCTEQRLGTKIGLPCPRWHTLSDQPGCTAAASLCGLAFQQGRRSQVHSPSTPDIKC